MPQPYLVPVRPAFSRIAQSSGVSGSTSSVKVFPLIVRFAIASPLIGPIHRLDSGNNVSGKLELFKSIVRGVAVKEIETRREESRECGVAACERRYKSAAFGRIEL